jgi:phosphatidate cytidylyltransferase
MIRTRVLVGSILGWGALGLLVGDRYLAPWFPVLFVCMVVVGVLTSRELVSLFPAAFRPSGPFLILSVLATTTANWYPVAQQHLPTILPPVASAWEAVMFTFVGVLVVAFLVEMNRFREPGTAVPRLGLIVLSVAYVAILVSFLIQLRWLDTDPARTSLFLASTIFVPKYGDIGAFFAGTFLGRHKMTPILSPKKTWEGFVGGLFGAALAAVVIAAVGDWTSTTLFRGGYGEAIVFGIVVGVAGVLGDLAESLIKRDCQIKDASKSLPGFGGLLDVMDSVLFAAPVAYFWFRAA